MATAFSDWLSALTGCFACFWRSSSLTLNGRKLKIIRQLGEGGFSYVHLVEDEATQIRYALKEIYCPFGLESVDNALEEVNAYGLFSHPNIIKSIDHAVATDKSNPSAKIVYILLPYYSRGNLQDWINGNLVNHDEFPEDQLLQLMLGICKALKDMHQIRSAPARPQMKVKRLKGSTSSGARRSDQVEGGSEADEGEEAEGPMESRPLMEDLRDENSVREATTSYVHRDIKPANIMIDDEGNSILMDLGSLVTSPVHITSRFMANQEQELAAQRSTISYRAPELFDVKLGDTLDTKADIWSLGCVMYACLVGKSPFEARSEEMGGSLNLCIQDGDWRFPDEGGGNSGAAGSGVTGAQTRRLAGGGMSTAAAAAAAKMGSGHNANYGPTNSSSAGGVTGSSTTKVIREPVKQIVRRCLCVDPKERADVDEVMQLILAAQAQAGQE